MAMQKESKGGGLVMGIREGVFKTVALGVRGREDHRKRQASKRPFCFQLSPVISLFTTEKPLCFPVEGKQ